MSGVLDMSGNKVENVANGTVSTDAVNKGQLDAGLVHNTSHSSQLQMLLKATTYTSQLLVHVLSICGRHCW